MKNREKKLLILKSRQKDFIRLNAREVPDVKTVSSPHILITYAATRFDGADFHVGFTATKKSISKLAVVRNKIKRRLRAATNELIGAREELAAIDMLIIARKGAADIPAGELRDELSKLLGRIPINKVV